MDIAVLVKQVPDTWSERKLAEYLYREGMIDLYGTDCHHDRHLARLSKFATETNAIRLSENTKIY